MPGTSWCFSQTVRKGPQPPHGRRPMPGHSPAPRRSQGPYSASDQLPSLRLGSLRVTINLCDATARVPAELKCGIQTGNRCPREPGDAWELLPGPKRSSLHPLSRASSSHRSRLLRPCCVALAPVPGCLLAACPGCPCDSCCFIWMDAVREELKDEGYKPWAFQSQRPQIQDTSCVRANLCL